MSELPSRIVRKIDLPAGRADHSVDEVLADFGRVLAEVLAGPDPLWVLYVVPVGDCTDGKPKDVRVAVRYGDHEAMRLLLRRLAHCAGVAGAITHQQQGQIERAAR